jgi:hypothetical protein
MDKMQTLELWRKRFDKVLKLEAEAQAEYKAILRNYSHLLQGTRIELMLRKIMSDEAEHVKIAKKMINIVELSKKELTS